MVQPPRRQSSVLSSSSSGGRTIRAASRNRSRSSSGSSSGVVFSQTPTPEWGGDGYDEKLKDVLESGFGGGRMSPGPSTVRPAPSEHDDGEDEDEDEHFDYAAIKARLPSGRTYAERYRDVLGEDTTDESHRKEPQEVIAVPDEMRGEEEFGEFANTPVVSCS